MTAWIYLEDDFPLRIPLGILAHLSLGLVTGRPWAIAVPALVPLLAIPTESEEGGPGWAFALVIVAIPGAILVALGVVLRRWLGRDSPE
jgi:hypothetical protein